MCKICVEIFSEEVTDRNRRPGRGRKMRGRRRRFRGMERAEAGTAARLCEAGRRGGRHAGSGTGVQRRAAPACSGCGQRGREREDGEGFAKGQSHFLKRKNQIVRPEQSSIRPMAKK